MANFTNVQITNRGRALQAKAQAGAPLVFTRFRIGSGTMSGQQISDMTNLIQPVMWLSLNKSQASGSGQHTLGAPFSNADVTTGFYFREWGVFAQDPDIGEIMYCYGNVGAGAEYIPAGGGAEIVEQQLDMITLIGNATNVSATIDESLVFVTVTDFNNHTHDGTAGNGPKITSNGLANGAATDVVIGNRTVDDSLTASAGEDTPKNLWSKLANMIKRITGKSNWYTAPAITLETVNTKFGTGGHTHDGTAGNGPKIGSGGLADGAATDTVIGNRTVSDATAQYMGVSATLSAILGHIGYMLKAITGKSNWYTTPSISLETVSGRLNQAVNTTSNPTFADINLNGDGRVGKMLAVGDDGSAIDATLHIKKVSGFGRLLQLSPRGAGTDQQASMDGLILIGSTNAAANINWWSLGVNKNRNFVFEPGTSGLSGTNPLLCLEPDGVIKSGNFIQMYNDNTNEQAVIGSRQATGGGYRMRLLASPDHIYVGTTAKDGNDYWRVFNEGNWNKRSYVIANSNGTQTIAASNVWTKVLLETEGIDQLGEYNPTTSRFTAQQAGIYVVSAALCFNVIGANTECSLALYRNGSVWAYIDERQFVLDTFQQSARGCVVVHMAAGDYLELYANISGTNWKVEGQWTVLEVIRVA